MADEEQQPAAPAAGAYDPATLNTIIQQLMQPQQMPQPIVPQASSSEGRSWASLLGEAAGGGEQYGTTEQRESGGLRALMSLGTNMMANSGWAPLRTPMGQILATGLQGAQQSVGESQATVAAQAAAQQDYAEKQQEMNLQRIKVALPLLQLQGRQGLPSPFAQGAGGPNTSISAGAGGAAPALTGDLETDRKIIAQRESGGDPTKLNYVALADPTAYARGATASGKYQFVNSTWQDGMKLAGLDPSKYPTAMSAPESVQDQVFTAVYKRDGTKPWDASTFKQNWVPTPTGQMVLANVVPGTKAAPATAAVPPAAPAPYKVAGPVVAPPSGTTAPATATPAADDTFFPNAPSAAPAPQQTSQADQPPAQPPVTTPPAAPPLDLKSAPDTTLTPEQYTLKHWTPLTPDEVQRYAPGPENQLAVDRARQVQQAQADAAAARRTYLNVQSGRVPGDLNKSLSDMNTADARADAAEKDYNTAVQGLKTEGAKNLLAADDQQRQQLRGDFKSTVLDPAAQARELAQTAAEKEKDRQAAVALANIQAKNKMQENEQTSNLASRQKVLEGLDTEATSAHENLTQLQIVKQLSDAAGQPGILASYPELRSWLVRTGIASEDQTQQWSAQQALDAASNKLTLAARQGSGMSRMTNMDLQFLQHTSPQSFNPQDWRNAQIAYLTTLYQRQQQFAGLVHRGVADGRSLTDAQNAADAELGPTIKTMPTTNKDGTSMTKNDQAKWNFDNLTPNSFYKDPTGRLRIFAPGDATRPE